MRGGERVLEELCKLPPRADLYAHVADPNKVSSVLRDHLKGTTWINSLPLAKRLYKAYLPLMPFALETLDLSRYDLVVSSESGPAKGVVLPADTAHICYCHTPMRYIWSGFHDYRKQAGPLGRLAIPAAAHWLRLWDKAAAERVDFFVANSRTVAQRIWKYYRREARIVHPPVDIHRFTPTPHTEDYYLFVGQLTAYKRADLAIAACNRLGRRLIVVGNGPQMKQLQAMAGPHIVFAGRASDAELADFYAKARALLFPGEEDFGIVPVEAMAAGRPVIAFSKGGALETVVPEKTGVFFHEQTVHSLQNAMLFFEEGEAAFTSDTIAEHARRFCPDTFRNQMREALWEVTGNEFFSEHHSNTR